MALIDNLEGVEKLLAEIRTAAPVMGERRQGLYDGEATEVAAILG